MNPTFVKNTFIRRYLSRKQKTLGLQRLNSDDATTLFDSFMEGLEAKPIFIHASMRSIRHVFGTGDPLREFMDCFRDRFPTIMAPGFTPSFRKSGVFHATYSRPEYGAFSELCLNYADGRTLDPIHSILYIGENPFGDCMTDDTFSPTGHFATVNDIDSWILNFGTQWFTSTQLHLVERIVEAPYLLSKTHTGIAYKDAQTHFPVEITNYAYSYPVAWQRLRINRVICRLPSYRRLLLGTIPVQAVKSMELTESLLAHLSKDPYFLVR